MHHREGTRPDCLEHSVFLSNARSEHSILGIPAEKRFQRSTTIPCANRRRNGLRIGTSGDDVVMARWPDNLRATLVTALLVFVVFPLLCFLAWWYVTMPP